MLPNTLTLKLYVVKVKVYNHVEGIEHISNKQLLVDLLTKGLPPNAFREHTVGMGLWYTLCFPNNIEHKVKESTLELRRVL